LGDLPYVIDNPQVHQFHLPSPALSPDLNPIEMAFSKLKALPRKFAERTADALWGRLAELINAFSPRECANYIKDAGYGHSI
jgi:transposase